MSGLFLLPDEEILDQRIIDITNRWSHPVQGAMIVSNRRLIVCSYSKPRDAIKGGVVGVAAKALGPIADFANLGANLLIALGSKEGKPLYPVFAKPFEKCTITRWKWGFALGIYLQASDGTKLSVRIGRKRDYEQWLNVLVQTIRLHQPKIEIAQTDSGNVIDQLPDIEESIDDTDGEDAVPLKNIWVFNLRGKFISLHRMPAAGKEGAESNGIKYELRVDGMKRGSATYDGESNETYPDCIDVGEISFGAEDDIYLKVKILEDTPNKRLPGGRWFRLSYMSVLRTNKDFVDISDRSLVELKSCSEDEYAAALAQHREGVSSV